MNSFKFYKYHGAGNDFIIIDDRTLFFDMGNQAFISRLCDRRFGIGADGLMLLQNSPSHDFNMIYYNSDGKQGTMCGNGGRCIVVFAENLGLINDETIFTAIDGVHKAKIIENNSPDYVVKLDMIDVNIIQLFDKYSLIDTGSPHYVEFVDDVESIDVYNNGQHIRYNSLYGKEGVNVNFVELINNHTLSVRTYERGVEAETYSCGTGATACALIANYRSILGGNEIDIIARGGNLSVSFEVENSRYFNVKLKGPAQLVYVGDYKL